MGKGFEAGLQRGNLAPACIKSIFDILAFVDLRSTKSNPVSGRNRRFVCKGLGKQPGIDVNNQAKTLCISRFDPKPDPLNPP
ncbi:MULTISPECIES: hypothetical protein [unclassified Microcoleus]|uniref:hypothetical protein n=1 Tax=unclassified Microcoleus TaxID=2642155 RepID=UPI002FD276F9